ncbi:MAG TPA: choice-of-anchor B family protein [Longimicrobiales bacterium]|nr:choice-of-anchor B family protein [Longimicrobiales bacterium]
MKTAYLRAASALGLFAAVSFTSASAQALRTGYGATVARYGDLVVVAEANNLIGPAAVYAYAPSGDGWTETVRLPQSAWQEEDGFGTAMAVAGDLLVVSAPGQDEGRGAIYTYQRSAAGIAEVGRMAFPDAPEGAGMGAALAGDDGLLVVGGRAGPPRVYAWTNGSWQAGGELTADDVTEDDGYGLALAAEGDVALVGAPRQAEGLGAVYAFHLQDGAWTPAGKFEVRGLAANDGFGQTIALNGTAEAFVGAPNRNGNGEVYRFTRDAASGRWSAVGRLAPFAPGGRDQFGTAIAASDERVMIGGALANNHRGGVYVFERGEDGSVTSARFVGREDDQRGTRFAQSLAVAGDVAVVGAPGDDNGAGTALVYVAEGGSWRNAATLASTPEGLDAVTGGEVACASGEAALWSCEQVDLVSFLPITEMGAGRGNRLNDVWGWTDPETGREYALVGRIDGLSIVDLSDAASPVYVGDLPMTPGSNSAVWRDMKVYDDHVYVVADGAGQHGMQVLDLKRLREVDAAALPLTFEPDLVYDGIASAHNIVINEGSGYAYIVGARGGGETCGGGLHMVDIREPLNPTFVGCFQDPSTGRAGTGYSHDAQCVMYEGPDQDHAGKEICIGSNETALSIADVTDKSAPVALSRAEYPNFGYTHQAWLTDDHRYLYVDDELDEMQGKVENTRTLIWDVSDLDDPQLVKEYFGPTRAIDHNLYIKGDFAYQSNNTAGLRILDISDPENPEEVGHFDTIPYGGDRPVFGGSWSAYPYFKSGTIVVTGGPLGLFLLRKQEPVS